MSMVAFFPVTPSQLATTKVISSRFLTTTLFGRLDELTVEVEELDELTLVEMRLFTGVDVAEGLDRGARLTGDVRDEPDESCVREKDEWRELDE